MLFRKSLLSTMLLLCFCFTYISCKGEQQKAKEALIQQSLTTLKAEKYTLDQEELQQPKSADETADYIVGVWEVRNEYYFAVYEIEKHEGKYAGKVHYYNDGQTEYTGQNTEDDYFLEGLSFENGRYKNGKMHMPDGGFYYVSFTIKGDELTAKMTVQNEAYTEIWKRKKYE